MYSNFTLFALFQLTVYYVDNTLSLNSFTVKRKERISGFRSTPTTQKNITGCLPGNAVQGFFVWLFGLDLIYFYNAIAKY